MSNLLKLEEIDSFKRAASIGSELISATVLDNVKELNEKTQIEPWLREILHQPYLTSHSPIEIADIITTTVTVNEQPRLIAFVNKGKAYRRVTNKDVAHQFLKAANIPGLQVMVFLATGTIEDEALVSFTHVATHIDCDYLIINAKDLARIFISYGKICPIDGLPLMGSNCTCGFEYHQDKIYDYFISKDSRDPAILKLAISEKRVIRGTFSTFGFLTSKMPTISIFVYIPRIGKSGYVNFLIDTGADSTALSPKDIELLGISSSDFRKSSAIIAFGLGGSINYYRDKAILIFHQGDGEILTYECVLNMQDSRQTDKDDPYYNIPSLLGRDILGKLSIYMNSITDELYLISKVEDDLK